MQHLYVEGKGLHHARFWTLFVQVWFDVVPDLAVPMLFGTWFSDGFSRGIFSSERKFVPWHSHPAAILSSVHPQKLTLPQKATLISKNKLGKHVI